MQRQQILVAAQDHASSAIQRHFQKSVIVGIAALVDRVNDRHEFGDAAEQAQELLAVLYADITVKLGASEHVRQFFHGGFGNQQDRCIHCLANRQARDRIRQQKAADKAICINDNALAAAHLVFEELLQPCFGQTFGLGLGSHAIAKALEQQDPT